MAKFYILNTIFLFLLINVHSQEVNENESCNVPNKKTQKLISSAVNASGIQEKSEYFAKALESEPENASVYYDFGQFAYEMAMEQYEANPNPAAGDRSMVKAKALFEKSLALCPEYHSMNYYYLGVIEYSQNNKERAMGYFKQFKAYKNGDVSKYPEDYDKKIADINSVLKEFEDTKDMMATQVPFNPSKVPNVSSVDDEYFPMISPDNELMFYTRKIDRKNLGDIKSNVVEEFTFSQRNDAFTKFDTGKPFTRPFNDGSFSNYGAATMSVDNKEMILCACKTETVKGQQYNNCDLYITTYERTGDGGNDFVWSELKNMGPEINTKDGWEGQPSLSADGNTLYYTATRLTTRDNDIFVVERNEDGTWGTARPFDEINTDGKDKSPFLHQDSETLYFVSSVSDKRKGAGGTDIFYTRKVNGQWSKPKNIGIPINTQDDELGIFVSTDGKLAYYSSRQGGDWNIYAFELYAEARPQAVAIIKGELKDEKGEPVSDAIIEITYANSDEVSKVRVNGNDGKYAAVVKTDTKNDVMVTVKKENMAFDSKLIAKETFDKPVVSVKQNDLQVKELKVGEAYTINDILYGTSSDVLSEKAKFILKGFARFLNENPNVKISIQGHTDDIGDDNKNLELSEKRAQGVKNYLISLGIDSKRLDAKGYGETKPKLANSNEVNRAKNRRTDFEIIGL